MNEWKPSNDKCPKCEQPTEVLVMTDEEGIEYDEAERCKPCGWQIDF